MRLEMLVSESIELLQKNESKCLALYPDGYHLAFSGGKDSQVLYSVAKKSGVKFKAYFYVTTVDPPELLNLIRTKYPDVIWLKPKLNMMEICLKKRALPTRLKRFCCFYLKENQGANSFVLTGIRAAESQKRAKRQMFEIACAHGKDKLFFHPLLNWPDKAIYEYLKINNIKICDYYQYSHRVSCVGCPQDNKRQKADFVRYPRYKNYYLRIIRRLREEKGIFKNFNTDEDVLNWWTSGKSMKHFFANQKQTKIIF